MRTVIPYFIVHKDKDRALNFAYRGEVPLMIGPGRALQVLTPVVRMTSGEEVRFALYNITRQLMKAEAWVKDSIIADSRVQVSLARKDDITMNRLPLAWQDTTEGGTTWRRYASASWGWGVSWCARLTCVWIPPW